MQTAGDVQAFGQARKARPTYKSQRLSQSTDCQCDAAHGQPTQAAPGGTVRRLQNLEGETIFQFVDESMNPFQQPLLRPALFLDRDGVIIENRANYVRSWADVTFYEQALEALRRLRDTPYVIVIVTNQSAVGRGILTLTQTEAINQGVVAHIRAQGGRVDAAYLCPHAPDEGCACRKPQPGMLRQAAADLHLDLTRSWMVGDALTDIQAGQAAPVGHTALVRTGRGEAQLLLCQKAGLSGYLVAEDLLHLLPYLL